MAEAPTCPHCGHHLKKWLVPDGASWTEEYLFVCFNDDCSYYREGWEWMEQQYSQHASDSATREMIVEDDEGENE
jgi:hypothetical protein